MIINEPPALLRSEWRRQIAQNKEERKERLRCNYSCRDYEDSTCCVPPPVITYLRGNYMAYPLPLLLPPYFSSPSSPHPSPSILPSLSSSHFTSLLLLYLLLFSSSFFLLILLLLLLLIFSSSFFFFSILLYSYLLVCLIVVYWNFVLLFILFVVWL